MQEDFLFSEKSNFIVVQRRGTKISDVWKLEEAIIEYNEKAKGWHIITNKNAGFFISGDIEIWEVTDKESPLWNMYYAYHEHANTKSYQEIFLAQAPPPPPPPPVKRKFFRWPYAIKWNW